MKRYLLWMLILFSLLLLSCHKEIAVESVKFEKATVQLRKGEIANLKVVILPEDATDKAVTWSSSDESIASVDQNGKVSALKVGNSTITATAGGLTATCKVTITADVTSISLNKTALSLKKGESETLTATVEPNDATDKTVSWSSSHYTVASVDKNGKVIALKSGITTILATVGGLAATCKVTVTADVTSISLNKTALTLKKGESETLTATVEPNDATDKTVSWSSSDNSVVSVDQNGKVTALKGGNATITAQASGFSAECIVSVIIPVQNITIDPVTLELEEGETHTLTVTISPQDATEKTVTWTSSSSDVVTVDQTGNLKALIKGNATITAMIGDKSASCYVVVKQKGTNLDDPEGFNNNEEEW